MRPAVNLENKKAPDGNIPSPGASVAVPHSVRVLSALLALIALILAGGVLHYAQSVLVPLVLAWVLSQLLGPVVVTLVRRRVPAGLAITLVMIFMLLLLYWGTVFISASAASFIEKLPAYRLQLAAVVSDIMDKVSVHLEGADARVRDEIANQLALFVGQVMRWMGNLVGALTSLLANIVMILIMLAFMLAGKPYADKKIQYAFSSDAADRIRRMMKAISNRMTHYLFFQFLISLATGILVWLVCRLAGVNSASTWGALAFFLNFIPTVGSIVAAIPPVLLALLQFYPSLWPAIIVCVAIVGVNQVLGNIVGPKLMGDRLDLSPVVILLSLLFWGWLWGIVGAFLSVILAGAIKIVCEEVEELRPFSVIMGSGRRFSKSDPSAAS